MGKETVRFNCRHCLHCCTDVVCLPTPFDVIHIVQDTGSDPDRFLEFLAPDEVTGVAKSDPTWLSCNGSPYVMALRRGKKDCYFLRKKKRVCRIYECRPILCRLYPFKLHETRAGAFKAFSLHRDVGCPRCTDGIEATKPLYDLYLEDVKHQEEYNDLVRVFNRRKHSRKRPQDFIDLFISRKE